jgi:predicted transcriptional regulator
MPSPRSSKTSVQLKPTIKKSLAKLAKSRGRSSNLLISDAVESLIEVEKLLAAEVLIADREVASGHYIKHEDMKAWLLSWGTMNELPPPKCVCGKNHSENPR